jgi:hypothetical protein
MDRMNTARWVQLDEVVKEYISQAELNMAHYRRLWNIAFRGLEDMMFNIYQMPKTTKLTVLPNKTVKLPGDYVSYVKIGVLNSEGEVATLTKNPNMSMYAQELSNRTDVNTDAPVDPTNIRDFVYLNYDNNGSLFNLYGLGGFLMSAGNFNIDEETGIIILDNGFEYEYVILEYLSSPREDEEYKVPILIKEALISWIAWKDYEYKPMGRRFQEMSKEQRRVNYVREKKKAKLRINPVRLWEANDIIRAGEVLAVKG